MYTVCESGTTGRGGPLRCVGAMPLLKDRPLPTLNATAKRLCTFGRCEEGLPGQSATPKGACLAPLHTACPPILHTGPLTDPPLHPKQQAHHRLSHTNNNSPKQAPTQAPKATS